MKAAAFAYHRIADIDELLHRLAEAGDEARILAGGQSLVPMLNFRVATPSSLLDISRLAALPVYPVMIPKGVEIGAGYTVSRAGGMGGARHLIQPLLARALPWVAHPAVRNRGTIGGSLALGGSGGGNACLLPGARRRAGRSARQRGERIVPAEHFFRGLYETDLRPDEALLALRLPGVGPRFRCGHLRGGAAARRSGARRCRALRDGRRTRM